MAFIIVFVVLTAAYLAAVRAAHRLYRTAPPLPTERQIKRRPKPAADTQNRYGLAG